MKKHVFVVSLLLATLMTRSLMAQEINPILTDSFPQNITFTLPNGPSFEMIYIQGGTFTMGCTDDQKGKCENDAEPAHQVVITDFYAGKYEVTQALWTAVMGTTIEQQCKIAGQHNVYGVGDDYPMYYIHFREANALCENLNQILANQLPEGYEFALPSEAQWEYAAKKDGEANWIYAGGSCPDSVANFKDSSEKGSIEEVGLRAPNGLELYDMSGNVSEWCNDGNANRKHIRGGSYLSDSEGITVTHSDVASIDNKSKTIGLRLVLNQ